jgi:hypothetical protein
MGMGERLERGAIYNVDLTNGQITKQSSPPFRGGGYLALDAKR